MARVFTSLAAALLLAAGCDQNMSDRPLPEASREEVAVLASALAAAPGLSAPAGANLSGVIDLAPGLGALTAPDDVLFVMARDPASEGPPLAVQRLTGNAYPMPFVLETPGEPDGGASGRPLQLIVKVDKDGDAGTSSAEDLIGFTPEGVAPGESGVRIRVEATLGQIAAALEEAPAGVGDAATGRAREPGSGDAPAERGGAGAVITGTISLAEAARGRTSPEDVVFVIAREPGTEGPPLAVARLPGDGYPMAFRLDDSHRMLGAPWPEAVELEVRVDRDGDPLTLDRGGLVGRAPSPVRPGERGVRVEVGG
jgi:hypothetical protein